MLFQFGDTLAEIDTEATRNYYLTHNAVNDCACLGCQNFRQWTRYCPAAFREQFQEFGIDDMNVISEIIPFGAKIQEYKLHNGMLYGGCYHVIGEIVQSGQNADMKLSDQFMLFLPGYAGTVRADFPKPVLQIEICVYVPWVLAASMENYIK